MRLLPGLIFGSWRSGNSIIPAFTLGMRANKRLQAHTVSYVHPNGKQIGQILGDANILEQVDMRVGSDFDHDIDVAVRTILAPRHRAEQRGMNDSALP